MVLLGGYNFNLSFQTLFDKYEYFDLLDIVETFVNSPYNKKIGWKEVKEMKFMEFEFLIVKIKEKIALEDDSNDEIQQAMNNKNNIPQDNIIGDLRNL